MTPTVALRLPAGAASATPPDRLGPFIKTYSFTAGCGDFERPSTAPHPPDSSFTSTSPTTLAA
jgi:hypothetical protein